jgi:DNA-binding XRE family transcriptional regulator
MVHVRENAGMTNDRLSHADLASRRRRAGASREAMAAGLGLRPEDIQKIEEGRASEEMVNHYGQWLDRIEAWPTEKRAQQLLAAIDSAKRFDLNSLGPTRL